jgi:hypothetical protein
MPLLLKHIECVACGHRHHFSLATGNLVPGGQYEYVCPETAKKASLRPASVGEVVACGPQGAVALTPVEGARTEWPAGTSTPKAGPTLIEEVLPEIKDLAAKVGGLEHLSDIVETLKKSKE